MPRKGQGRIKGRPVTKAIPQPAGGVQLETFVPWALVKRGARKKVVTPSGAPESLRMETVPPRDAEMEAPELRALGLAHYWQHLLDTGKVGSLREIAAAEGMDLGRVSRIARLAWVGPSVVDAASHGDGDN
ncbi:LacI family transcriptional regulator [Methylolobus aquaticus]|nr:LacI family transcriptional regulator [Methylolobus aquaticus]